MSFIPSVKPLYPDELLYSWIHRLSKTNGLLIKDFSDAYLGTANAKIGSLSYDIRNGFISLYENLLKRPDIIELFLSTSTIEFESMFMTEGQQTKLINNTFAPKSIIITPSNGLLSNINVCPECMKADIEKYGEPYIHRHHQFSGVCTCHKHHCRLMTFNGTKGHACDYNVEEYVEIQSDNNIDTDNGYTDYASALFESRVNTSIKTLKEILYADLKLRKFTARDGYSGLIKLVDNSKYKSLIKNDVVRFLKNKMISATYIDSTELLPIFMVLYPNSDDLISLIKEKADEPIIKEYECSDCGKKYVSTPYAVRNKLGCPNCNVRLSEQDIVVNIFNNSGYELRGKLVSADKKVLLYHDKCGKETSISPRAFIFEEVRCLCESTISFKDAQKAVKSAGDFELIKFTNSDSFCEILSKECGHTFKARYRKFIKYPHCRICYPKDMTTEYLAERIRNTTNGEYELAGEFVDQKTKIKILHKPCGNITEYSPRYFHDGASCPICNNSFDNKWNEMFSLLCNYKEKYGHTNIPKRDSYKNKPLGLWCQKQRDNTNISNERRNKLSEIGFLFDPKEEEWNRRFEQYKRYVSEKGTSYISRRTDYEGEHLGAWVETQRKWYTTGKMSQERIDKLLSVNSKLFT